MVGSPGEDTKGLGSGAAYAINTEFQRVRFEHKKYQVLENGFRGENKIQLNVLRDGDLSGALTVQWATSDITAIGVHPQDYRYCMNLPTNAHRKASACGDYMQGSGEITFLPTEFSKPIVVYIVDDYCYEYYMEYIRVQLIAAGGGPLIGERYTATIRIDDNDFDRTEAMPDYC
jgi:hypothetical protein